MGATEVCDAHEILQYYGWEIKQNTVKQQKEKPSIPVGLDFFQTELYNLLLKGDFSMQQIIDLLGKSASEVSMALTMLELKGLIEKLPGNMFGIKG